MGYRLKNRKDTVLVIVMELCDLTLKDLLATDMELPADFQLPDDHPFRQLSKDEIRARLFRQLFEGVTEMHKERVLHRDLKPENVFIKFDQRSMGEGFTVKIGDMGLATILSDQPKRPNYGTPTYMAPEVSSNDTTTGFWKDAREQNLSEEDVLEKLEELEGTPVDNDEALENLKLDDAKQDQLSIHWVSTYDERADFYSLGVIGMEIFSKSDSQMERGVKLRAVRDHEVLPDNIPSPEKEILQDMIRRDPNERLWQEAVIRQQLQPVRPPPPDLREMMQSAHYESRQRTLDRLGVARRTDFVISPGPRDVSPEFGIRSRPR